MIFSSAWPFPSSTSNARLVLRTRGLQNQNCGNTSKLPLVYEDKNLVFMFKSLGNALTLCSILVSQEKRTGTRHLSLAQWNHLSDFVVWSEIRWQFQRAKRKGE